jgi:molecular chaperone HscB
LTPTAVSTAKLCPACGAELASPLLCESCNALLDPPAAATPFELLGFQPSYALDAAAVRKRVLALSRVLHPDFHANASDETRRRAEDNTAALNAAFHLLSDDARRADWLVRHLGGPGENEERMMPPLFLEEVLEWNEAIEEARASAPDSPARADLVPLTERLRNERAIAMGRLAARLTPLPPRAAPTLRTARQELNAVRYLDRALRELGELRLATRV